MVNNSVRGKDDEWHKASAIVAQLKKIKAYDILSRSAEILKDNSLRIVQSGGNPKGLEEIQAFIDNILFATPRLSLNSLKEFNDMICGFFGEDLPKIDIQRINPDL